MTDREQIRSLVSWLCHQHLPHQADSGRDGSSRYTLKARKGAVRCQPAWVSDMRMPSPPPRTSRDRSKHQLLAEPSRRPAPGRSFVLCISRAFSQTPAGGAGPLSHTVCLSHWPRSPHPSSRPGGGQGDSGNTIQKMSSPRIHQTSPGRRALGTARETFQNPKPLLLETLSPSSPSVQ